jgi:aspartyl-tRNA(Asn)/glutamyl-tRNA(Gln) amidotransferase subunit A
MSMAAETSGTVPAGLAVNRPGIAETASRLASGATTAEALTSERLDAIAATEHGGFVRVTADQALDQARNSDRRRARGRSLGPLDGIPLAHKDMFFRAGQLSGCGSALLDGYVPAHTSPLLDRLDSAGAVDLGRLHMSELALSPMGRNDHIGDGRNPWNRKYVSGGSSSGSAMAVAHGLVFAALGSDTGGSVRIPAGASGMTALKPTQGTLSTRHAMPLSPSLDCPGIMAPTAADCAAVFAALAPQAGPASSGRQYTVAIPDIIGSRHVTDEIVENFVAASEALAAAGVSVKPSALPDFELLNQVATIITGVEAFESFRDYLQARPGAIGDQVRRRVERGALYPAHAYTRALRIRPALLAGFLARHLKDADAIILPTLAFPVPTIEDTRSDDSQEAETRFGEFSYWTRAINYLGLPAVCIPSGFAGGMPTGIQLVGRPHAEAGLLAQAHRIQAADAWQRTMPATASV